MKTIIVKSSENSGEKRQRVNRRVVPNIFHVTGSETKAVPDPEVVDAPNDDLNRKELKNDDNIRSLWSEFRDNTTMHGLKNANLKKRRKLRCGIWAVALFAMGCFLLYTTYEQFTNYFKYPTITNTHVQTQTSVKFPAVTFCSASSLKRESLPEDLQNLEYFFLTESVMGSFFPKLNFSNPQYSNYHVSLNESWVMKTANQVEDLFLFCFFEGKDKICKNVMKPTVTKLGVCYTFNSREKVRKHGDIITTRTVSTSGLRLYLMVKQFNYVFSDAMAAGIKVIIHDQREEPEVVDKGFLVSPGFSTFASVHKTEYHYLPSPYKMNGNQFCVDTQSPEYTNPLHYYDVYSKTACKMECKQKHVVKICGCRSPYDRGQSSSETHGRLHFFYLPWAITSIFSLEGNDTICSLVQLAECFNVESERFDQNVTAQNLCICPTECRYTEYHARLSTGYFPAKNYQTVLNHMGITNIRETYLELAIYFESLGVLTVTQIPEYNFEDIIGLLGGQMGLFLGASLLTLTELFEFLVLSSVVIVRRIYSRCCRVS